jgi:hypothetical protein
MPSGTYQYWGMDGDYETYYRQDLVGTNLYGNAVYKPYWIHVVPAEDGGVQRIELNTGSGSLNASWHPNTGWQVDYIIPSLITPETYTIDNQIGFSGENGATVVGGAYTPSGTGGAFVEQAQELNVGLEFNNGQWAPAQ